VSDPSSVAGSCLDMAGSRPEEEGSLARWRVGSLHLTRGPGTTGPYSDLGTRAWVCVRLLEQAKVCRLPYPCLELLGPGTGEVAEGEVVEEEVAVEGAAADAPSVE